MRRIQLFINELRNITPELGVYVIILLFMAMAVSSCADAYACGILASME